MTVYSKEDLINDLKMLEKCANKAEETASSIEEAIRPVGFDEKFKNIVNGVKYGLFSTEEIMDEIDKCCEEFEYDL